MTPAVGAEVPHREGEHRGRQQPRQQDRAEPGTGEQLGRVAWRRRASCGGRRSRSRPSGRRSSAALSRRYAAKPAAACATSTRFMRLLPAPSSPRRPAVPKASRPCEAVGEIGGGRGIPAVARSMSAASSARVSGSGSCASQRGGALQRVFTGGRDRLAHSAPITRASSAEITGSASRPASITSCVAERRGLDAGGHVRDEREAEDLHAGLAGGDRLERGRHADDVPADGLRHLHLGRGLVLRSAELAVHALVEARVDGAGEVAQPHRVQVGEVDERRALERRVRR